MNTAQWKWIMVAAISAALGFALGNWGIGHLDGRPARENSAANGLITGERDGDPEIPNVADARLDEFPAMAKMLLGPGFQGLPALVARRELMRRWIASDPESAYLYYAEEATFQPEYQEFAREWARSDPDGFIAFTRTRKDWDLFGCGAWELTGSHPDIVVAAIEKNEIRYLPEELLSKLITAIGKADFQKAERFVEEYFGRADGGSVFLSLGLDHFPDPHFALAEIRLSDGLDSAIQWAAAKENPGERKRLLAYLISESALAGNAESAALYQSLRLEHGRFAFEVARAIAEKDPVRAIEWIQRSADAGEARGAMIDVVGELHEPGEIERAYGMLESEMLRDTLARHLLMNWGSRDLEAGLEFVFANSTGEARSSRLQDLAAGVGSTQFADANALADHIPDPVDRQKFRRKLIADYAEAFPERALELAKDTGDAELYLTVLERSIESHVESGDRSVEDCAALLSQLPEDRTAGDASRYLAYRWWREDSSGAVAWVESIQHPRNRQIAIDGLLSKMAEDQPEAAIAFANSRTDPTDRQTAITSLVENIGGRKPETLFPMAAGLDPGKERSNLLTRLVGAWARQSPDAASVAIRESVELTQREKERLLARIYTD